jgi:opine dehydrogenase
LKLKAGVYLAALPAKHTDQVLKILREVYPAMVPARNILQTSLQNGNPVIHPAVTLLNTASIERTGGDFLFYEEGITPAVGRLLAAIDRERIAIGERLGLEILADPEIGFLQGYMAEKTYDKGYAQAPGFRGIQAQKSLEHRYIQEDVSYGLVFWHSLALQVGVETPNIQAVIQLASVLMGVDYMVAAPRTMASLGLSGYSMDELERMLG